jgi:hypothetical protein
MPGHRYGTNQASMMPLAIDCIMPKVSARKMVK